MSAFSVAKLSIQVFKVGFFLINDNHFVIIDH